LTLRAPSREPFAQLITELALLAKLDAISFAELDERARAIMLFE